MILRCPGSAESDDSEVGMVRRVRDRVRAGFQRSLIRGAEARAAILESHRIDSISRLEFILIEPCGNARPVEIFKEGTVPTISQSSQFLAQARMSGNAGEILSLQDFQTYKRSEVK